MPDIGRVMGGEVERRAARRFAMSLPMKVRFVSDDGAVEESGETRDISFRGLYFMLSLIHIFLQTRSAISL